MKIKLGSFLKVTKENDSIALWNQCISAGLESKDFDDLFEKEIISKNCISTLIFSIVGDVRIDIGNDEILLETGDSLLLFGEQKFSIKKITNDAVIQYITYED